MLEVYGYTIKRHFTATPRPWRCNTFVEASETLTPAWLYPEESGKDREGKCATACQRICGIHLSFSREKLDCLRRLAYLPTRVDRKMGRLYDLFPSKLANASTIGLKLMLGVVGGCIADMEEWIDLLVSA